MRQRPRQSGWGELKGEGAHVLSVFHEGDAMREGLEVDVGGLVFDDEVGAGVRGQEFVVARADDDGKAARGEGSGNGVGG